MRTIFKLVLYAAMVAVVMGLILAAGAAGFTAGLGVGGAAGWWIGRRRLARNQPQFVDMPAAEARA
jgi:ABC-type phosphate transport system permease subunit